jgi:hypothetical protein
MQTMSALVRVAGDLNMTVQRHKVTPAEALVLMHIHDAATKDVFEGAVLTADVERGKVEERERLHARYPEAKKLIEQLFPGRNAADIPDNFDELQDTPLEVANAAPTKAPAPATKKAKAKAAPADDAPLSDEEAMNLMLHGDKGQK